MIFDINWEPVSETVLKEKVKNRKVFLFGVTPRNTQIYEIISKDNIFGIYDNDSKKHGMISDEFLVLPPPDLAENIIIISTLRDYKNIIPQIKGMGVTEYFLIWDSEYFEGFKDYYNAVVIKLKNTLAAHSFRYIHVIQDEKFIKAICEAIEAGFDMSEHMFVIYSIRANDIYNNWSMYERLQKAYGNVFIADDLINWRVIDWQKELKILDQYLNNCEKVIFHGEWLTEDIRIYFAEKTEILKKKGVWFSWSANISQDECNELNIRDVLSYVRLLFSGRADVAYKKILEHYTMPYHIRLKNNLSYARWLEKPVKTQIEDGSCNVFIGQSCFDYNNNLQTLKFLERVQFKDKLNIYCITSYGDGELIKEVENYGKTHYGDKFFSISKFLSYNEYVELLNSMDVAVLGLEYHAAHTTRQLLMWLGVKVYIKAGTDVEKVHKAQGSITYNYYDIVSEDFDTFMEFPEKEKQVNFRLTNANYDKEHILKAWRELFEFDMEKGIMGDSI